MLDISRLKLNPRHIRPGDDPKAQREGQKSDQGRGDYVRSHHSPIAHTAGQDRDDLAVSSHPGCEKYDCDEHEQRAEHVHEVRHPIDVVIQNDRLQRSLVLNEMVDLLAYVEDDDNGNDKQ